MFRHVAGGGRITGGTSHTAIAAEPDDARFKVKRHHIRVDAFRLVVPFAQSDALESEPVVQRDGRVVDDADFEQHPSGSLSTCARYQVIHHRDRDALPLMGLADAYVHDLRVVAVIPVSGESADGGFTVRVAPIRLVHVEDVYACRRVELLPDRGLAPRMVAEQLDFQRPYRADGRLPPDIVQFAQHQSALCAPAWFSTCLSGLGTSASGRRRYSGSTGASSSACFSAISANIAKPAAPASRMDPSTTEPRASRLCHASAYRAAP